MLLKKYKIHNNRCEKRYKEHPCWACIRWSKLCIVWETAVINDCKEREGYSVYYYAYVGKKI